MIGLMSFVEMIKNFFFLVGYVSNYQVFPEPLSPEEEEKYLIAYANGDENANKIIL